MNQNTRKNNWSISIWDEHKEEYIDIKATAITPPVIKATIQRVSDVQSSERTYPYTMNAKQEESE